MSDFFFEMRACYFSSVKARAPGGRNGHAIYRGGLRGSEEGGDGKDSAGESLESCWVRTGRLPVGFGSVRDFPFPGPNRTENNRVTSGPSFSVVLPE